ncbi:hypothetical protein LLG95_13315, partial [bacterium]|nr:hypothetical protein [bacterium]
MPPVSAGGQRSLGCLISALLGLWLQPFPVFEIPQYYYPSESCFPDKIFEQEATEVTEISAKRNYSVSSVSSCSILQFRNILCFSA